MTNITRTQYIEEIQSIDDNMVSEAINDRTLHETIDGHQWVIYNAYNSDVMRHSDNPDYYPDNFGNDDASHVLKERGLDGLHNVIAFWCMYADVQDRLSDAFDAYEEAHPLAD